MEAFTTVLVLLGIAFAGMFITFLIAAIYVNSIHGESNQSMASKHDHVRGRWE